MLGELKESCGVFGACIFSHNPIFPYIYWALRVQNHRGHQSHGFLTFNHGSFHEYKGLDLVPKIKKKELQSWLNKLPGQVGIGNVRYATFGGTDEGSLKKAIQPNLIERNGVKIAISFNGNIVNGPSLKAELRKEFKGFSWEGDAEIIAGKLLAKLVRGESLESSIRSCMEEVEGAFSVVGLTKDGGLFAFKDPHGIRPLCCGHNEKHKLFAFSSETVGLDINDLKFDFEVQPGEVVFVSREGFTRERLAPCGRKALCAFEFAYFARPDSRLGEKFVYDVREEFGRNLAREYPEVVKDADIIISLPETGDDAAYGVHEETGLRWERSVRRHRYVTERAFILLPQERYATIDKKINIIGGKVKGKRVIVIDDSIVRGDTTRVVVQKLRRMGARKVHLFITFPRIIGPCFYGIDMATYEELIGSKHEPEEIAKIIGADSVNYQSIDGFVKATGLSRDELCLGCVTGEYPTPLAQKLADEAREKFEKGIKVGGRIYER